MYVPYKKHLKIFERIFNMRFQFLLETSQLFYFTIASISGFQFCLAVYCRISFKFLCVNLARSFLCRLTCPKEWDSHGMRQRTWNLSHTTSLVILRRIAGIVWS